MPIKGLTDTLRLPRLGKIHLGEPMEGRQYPKPTDYFVCPPEVQAIYGEQPKELVVVFPLDAEEHFAAAFYKAFSRSRGLICKGDGESADRTVNMKKILGPDGVLDSLPPEPEHWPLVDNQAKPEEIGRRTINCHGTQCPDFIAKNCSRVMSLQFMLPEVEGLGVYQIDTGSRNGILNVYGSLEMVRVIAGRVSLIPMKLRIGPMKTQSPETGRAQTNYVLSLHCDLTIEQLQQKYSQLPPAVAASQRALPDPDDEMPTDLYPAEGTDAEGAAENMQAENEHENPPTPAVEKPKSQPDKPTRQRATSGKASSSDKLSDPDKNALLAKVRGTGISKDDWREVYRNLGIDWANLDQAGAAKVESWLKAYTKEQAAGPEWTGEESGGDGVDEQQDTINAEGEGQEADGAGPEGQVDPGQQVEEEARDPGDVSEQPEAAAGPIESAGEAETPDIVETTEVFAGESEEEPGEHPPPAGLEALLAYANEELGTEFTQSEFEARVLGMKFKQFEDLAGGTAELNDSFKRRISRMKEQGIPQGALI